MAVYIQCEVDDPRCSNHGSSLQESQKLWWYQTSYWRRSFPGCKSQLVLLLQPEWCTAYFIRPWNLCEPLLECETILSSDCWVKALKSVSLSPYHIAVTSSSNIMMLNSIINRRDLLYRVREVLPVSLMVHRPLGTPVWLGAVNSENVSLHKKQVISYVFIHVSLVKCTSSPNALAAKWIWSQVHFQAHFELQVHQIEVML